MFFMAWLRGGGPGAVLARVDFFVAEVLDEVVVSGRERGAHDRTEPVDPMVPGEAPSGHCGTEAAGRVEGAAGEEDPWGFSLCQSRAGYGTGMARFRKGVLGTYLLSRS